MKEKNTFVLTSLRVGILTFIIVTITYSSIILIGNTMFNLRYGFNRFLYSGIVFIVTFVPISTMFNVNRYIKMKVIIQIENSYQYKTTVKDILNEMKAKLIKEDDFILIALPRLNDRFYAYKIHIHIKQDEIILIGSNVHIEKIKYLLEQKLREHVKKNFQ